MSTRFRFRHGQAAALIIGASLATAACAALPDLPGPLPAEFVPTPSVSPGAGPGALSPDGFNAAQRMTLRVRNVGCGFLSTGSGFAYDANTLVTSRHVIEDSRSLEVSTHDGRVIDATAVASTTVADIAIVYVEEPLGSGFAILAQEDPVEGDIITVVGYPGGGRLTTTSGVVMGWTADPLGGAIGQVLATTAKVEPGSSGSPALNEAGQVVGVVYAMNDSDQSFIVPVSTLNTLLVEPSLLVPQAPQCAQ